MSPTLSPNQNTTDWLSSQQAADHLGVDPRTVRAMVARGELPAKRIGARGIIRIPAAALEPNNLGTTGHTAGGEAA